jgi:hypothetical protein
MDTKKSDLYTMLAEIIQRLERIESNLTQRVIKVSSSYLANDLSNLSSSESGDDPDDQDTQDVAYVSDNDTSIVMEESYDSDHDQPFELPEVYSEPKLLLTPLQIQLANEEFMQYKGHPDNDSE